MSGPKGNRSHRQTTTPSNPIQSLLLLLLLLLLLHLPLVPRDNWGVRLQRDRFQPPAPPPPHVLCFAVIWEAPAPGTRLLPSVADTLTPPGRGGGGLRGGQRQGGGRAPQIVGGGGPRSKAQLMGIISRPTRGFWGSNRSHNMHGIAGTGFCRHALRTSCVACSTQ